MLIVGIDPGKSGAVVSLYNGDIHTVHVMEDLTWFIDIMEELKADDAAKGGLMVYMERAQVIRGNGIVSMGGYMKHFGEMIGVLTTLKIPFETIHPSVWTKAIHMNKKKGVSPKAKSLQEVIKRFPGTRLTAPNSTRARVPHSGIVDALLIAEYGRRLLGGSKGSYLEKRKALIRLSAVKRRCLTSRKDSN